MIALDGNVTVCELRSKAFWAFFKQLKMILIAIGQSGSSDMGTMCRAAGKCSTLEQLPLNSMPPAMAQQKGYFTTFVDGGNAMDCAVLGEAATPALFRNFFSGMS